jgi:hypothetical protein
VTAQGTGHGAAAHGPLADTVLIKTGAMRSVEVDASARRARAGAGTLSLQIAEAAGRHGMAALLGSSPDVGVVGYTLGGGVGWLARRHGLAANRVTSAEVVTADGRILEVDAGCEPDLFWALRGGGGSFAIVTAIEFELVPLAELYAGTLFFPLARAGEVLAAWRDWANEAPEEVTSVGRLLRLPPLPDIPEPFRGGTFAALEVFAQLPESEAAALIEPLRRLGPTIDTVATMPAAALSRVHMDPDRPVPGVGDGALMSELCDEAIEQLVLTAGEGSGSPLLSVEIRQLGGALSREQAGAGAIGSIAEPFALYAVGMAVDEATARAVDGHLTVVTDAVDRWCSDRFLLNLADRAAPHTGFPEPVFRRLQEVKSAYDPGEVIRSNYPIPPLG